MINHWNIYEVDGYQEVSADLDQVLCDGIEHAKQIISDGTDTLQAARELFDSMDSVLDSYDGFGASDSEPRHYLATTINTAFSVII